MAQNDSLREGLQGDEMKDKARFARNLTVLTEIFKEKPLSKVVIQFYYKTLEHFDDDTVENAFLTAAQRCKFFPRPAEILEIIEGDPHERAVTAWQTLLSAIQKHGSYETIIFADSRIAGTVNLMGGWWVLCEMTMAQTPLKMRDFITTYKALPNQPQISLMGRHEHENILTGRPNMTKPIFIGSSPPAEALPGPSEEFDQHAIQCAQLVADALTQAPEEPK